jgi:GxxExxY protein
MEIETIGYRIIGAAINVHKALGPGLLESAYQKCLAWELDRAGLRVESEVPLPLKYEGILIDAGFRLDMRVEDLVIVENKVVEQILPIHEAQLLTYLRLTGCRLGYLLNWNVVLMKEGIRRMVHQL